MTNLNTNVDPRDIEEGYYVVDKNVHKNLSRGWRDIDQKPSKNTIQNDGFRLFLKNGSILFKMLN